MGVVTQEINFLRLSFSSFTVNHVRRQCNESAHILAHLAEQFIFSIFRNCVPDYIRQTLCNDVL
jgi:hypothetical protein